jgi:hypothetical protein
MSALQPTWWNSEFVLLLCAVYSPWEPLMAVEVDQIKIPNLWVHGTNLGASLFI